MEGPGQGLSPTSQSRNPCCGQSWVRPSIPHPRLPGRAQEAAPPAPGLAEGPQPLPSLPFRMGWSRPFCHWMGPRGWHPCPNPGDRDCSANSSTSWAWVFSAVTRGRQRAAFPRLSNYPSEAPTSGGAPHPGAPTLGGPHTRASSAPHSPDRHRILSFPNFPLPPSGKATPLCPNFARSPKAWLLVDYPLLCLPSRHRHLTDSHSRPLHFAQGPAATPSSRASAGASTSARAPARAHARRTTRFLPARARARPAHRPAAPAHSAPPPPPPAPSPRAAGACPELRGAARGRTGGRGAGKSPRARARLEVSGKEARPRLLLPLERKRLSHGPSKTLPPPSVWRRRGCGTPSRFLTPNQTHHCGGGWRGAAPSAPGQSLVSQI